MRNCRICDSETQNIFSFGRMPIANGFLEKTSDREYFYPLSLMLCLRCCMVQLRSVPAPKLMFGRSYAFISSTSTAMQAHFKTQAEDILRLVKRKKDPFVVELGCNDGIMLKHLAKKGIRHLGIEPAANVARQAQKNGVTVLKSFFDPRTAATIVRRYGKSDVICASNTLLSVENLNAALEGVKLLLSDNGVFFFEDPYLLDIVSLGSFDQIYDEHIYYFSGLSVANLARRHNFELVNMKHQDVHGGSMRYQLEKQPARKNHAVTRWLAKEKRKHLSSRTGFRGFTKAIRTTATSLQRTLKNLKSHHLQVVGYGATSKSTTLLNYAGIGPELVEYITDNSPTKIGKFTPGMHIPVKDREAFLADNPPYTLLFAWNHKREIYAKESKYRRKGGKFITYLPKIKIE